MNISEQSVLQEEAWVEALVREAQRDFVFLWHIVQGRFGGPNRLPAEFPSVVERVSNLLIKEGCIVGFGNPDSTEWSVPVELLSGSESKGTLICQLWGTNPRKYEFLVFAMRS